MGYRVERVNETIKNHLSTLIETTLKDPRLEEAVITITNTKTTPDLKYCKVFVSIYGKDVDKNQIIEILNKSKGFLRKQIAKALTTRTAPEFIFELDESIDYAMHIDEILKELKVDEYED